MDKRSWTAARRVITFQTVMSKKVASLFSGKIGVTPSVAAPGDTNPSDATGYIIIIIIIIIIVVVVRAVFVGFSLGVAVRVSTGYD